MKDEKKNCNNNIFIMLQITNEFLIIIIILSFFFLDFNPKSRNDDEKMH